MKRPIFWFVSAIALTAGISAANAGSLPSGWSGVGGYGTLGPNGVVTAPPAYGPNYYYVTTTGGVTGVGSLPGYTGPPGYPSTTTNGSTVTTNVFSVSAGSTLSFYFNYVTSDGSALTQSDATGSRLSLARMSSAGLVQTNGLGLRLCSRM